MHTILYSSQIKYLLQSRSRYSIAMGLAFMSLLLLISSASFGFQIPRSQTFHNEFRYKVGEAMKYNGKGFVGELQTVLNEAINDAAIYYNGNYSLQANFISKRMKNAKEGDWHIVIIENLNISKVTDVSTGFFYWNQNDTWALWHSASPFTQLVLHLVIYNGNTGKTTNLATTKNSEVGSEVGKELSQVISSIVKTLDTTQDIAKYIQKFDGRNWSVLSVPFAWAGKFPEAWACLSVSGVYITYNQNVTLEKQQYSQILFV